MNQGGARGYSYMYYQYSNPQQPQQLPDGGMMPPGMATNGNQGTWMMNGQGYPNQPDTGQGTITIP